MTDYSFTTQIFVNNYNSKICENRKESNKIISTRYTWYSFIPMVIFQQFQIISNFYFLICILINGIIDSPLPFGIDTFPLSLLIFLSIIARGYEEIKLYLSDKEINEQSTLYLKENKFSKCQFQSLSVGDIIKCENNCPFPADLLLLFSSRETNDCSVTTVNLDGESNLKTFHGVINSVSEDCIETEIITQKMKIDCINSCEDLQKYHGFLTIENKSEPNQIVLTQKNLLLRGAKLKNTDFIVACVVYVGKNTKLSLNSKIKKLKQSSVDSALYVFIAIYLMVQILLALISCLVSNIVYFRKDWFKNNWYIPEIKIGLWKQVEIFLGFFVLFNKILPVSLIFSIYSMKAFACFFFNMDLRMYDEDLDQRARVNTIELIEELGQIEYLFTDKTGTLTENKMKFHCCSTTEGIYRNINDELYSSSFDELNRVGKDFNQNLLDLFICLCLCHTVKVSNPDGSPHLNFSNNVDVSQLIYQACSPDEEAFLDAIRNYGITYLGSRKNIHYILSFEVVLMYKVVEILEFDSTRKCMSVIVEFPDGSSQLICKGAESSLFPLTQNKSMISLFMENLAVFSQQGLRVLLIAKKILEKDEVEKFCNQLIHYRRTPSLIDREFELYPLIENKLNLIGVTGVEDKLQEGVPQTIRDLKEAGIKIWVITGDKEETAINISLSAGHFDQNMFIHRLTNIESQENCVNKLNTLQSLLQLSEKSSHALVIDGKSFSFLVNPLLVTTFLEICSQVEATLCCRMTPLQKSQIVYIIKEYVKPTPITAAIGDGGNDVSMILEAHVGIGLFGNEGRQAARMADYAIGKFRFLRPAILLHGQNFYIRLTKFIGLFFYKSNLYVTSLFLYSFFNAFSALNLYDTSSSTWYNLVYSTTPILIYGVFEKYLPDRQFLDNPVLYKNITKNYYMNIPDFLKTFFLSVIQSTAVFFIVYSMFSFNFDFIGKRGNSYDYFVFGFIIFYCIWGVLLVKVALLSKHISSVVIIFFFANIALGISVHLIYQVTKKDNEYMLMINTFSEWFSWLLMFIIILICSIPDIILTLYRNYTTF